MAIARVKTVLVDPNAISRLGLRTILAEDPTLQVVAEVNDARSCCRVIGAAPVDVVITDLWLPGVDAVSLSLDLRVRSPRTRVVVFTASCRRRDVMDVLSAGAAAYVLKTAPKQEIVHAVRAVAAGQSFVSPAARLVVEEDAVAADTTFESLSEREREVFALAVRGFPNAEIGHALCISEKTVDSHRQSINEKLGSHSTLDLVQYALRRGLLREPVVERLPPGPPV